MKRTIVRIVFILLIVAIVGLYFYDLHINNTDPSENLFRTLSIVFLCLAGLARTSSKGRRTLKFYEAQYEEIIKYAFLDQPLWRNKLLCAIRLYSENNLDKSMKYLIDLRERCHSKEDQYAVCLFAALCYTQDKQYDQAEHIYQQMVNAQIADSRIFSNLGNAQNKQGKHEKALRNYQYALNYDRNNDYAYNNIAQAYFQMHQFEEAIPYAKKALEINPKMRQASSLLAVIYALLNDSENKEKYFHMAIASGDNANDLKKVIEYYRIAQDNYGEEDDDLGEDQPD